MFLCLNSCENYAQCEINPGHQQPRALGPQFKSSDTENKFGVLFDPISN